jgi:hypothetical protein
MQRKLNNLRRNLVTYLGVGIDLLQKIIYHGGIQISLLYGKLAN